jgi:hypothetical protein
LKYQNVIPYDKKKNGNNCYSIIYKFFKDIKMVLIVNGLNLPQLAINDEKTGKRLDIFFTSQIYGEQLEVSNIQAQHFIIRPYNDYSSETPETYTVTTEIKKKIEEHIKMYGNLNQNNINKIIFLETR